MAKFKREKKGDGPSISTASLPDIVFMLLIFLMVSTVLRDADLKVMVDVPGATEIKKMERKELVSTIFIGKPLRSFQDLYGTEPRIQLNDAFATKDDIRDFIASERENMKENDRPKMVVSLKVDEDTKMGTVTDVKQELRKASALKINYSTREVEKVY
jgi:biopolymer transport protein ExbD